jgi:hypothetical protein
MQIKCHGSLCTSYAEFMQLDICVFYAGSMQVKKNYVLFQDCRFSSYHDARFTKFSGLLSSIHFMQMQNIL